MLSGLFMTRQQQNESDLNNALTYFFALGSALAPSLPTPPSPPWGAETLDNAEGSIPAYARTAGPPATCDLRPAAPRRTARSPPPGAAAVRHRQQKRPAICRQAQRRHPGDAGLVPSYRLDIYPTHRTVNYPDYVQQNTLRNVISCNATHQERRLEECHDGQPFPHSAKRRTGDVEPPGALSGVRLTRPLSELLRARLWLAGDAVGAWLSPPRGGRPPPSPRSTA
jgi:hypothetical protein